MLKQKLIEASIKKSYYPFTKLNWPEVIEHDRFWMSEELISLYGTPEYENLTEQQKIKLSQMEFCLYCSINCFGEKELISDVSALLYLTKYEDDREYLHHFLHEENGHAYMFSEFVERYGEGNFYGIHKIEVDRPEKKEIYDILTFVYILALETLGVYYNHTMSKDENLPMIVRDLNHTHYVDELRHLSFGRDIVTRKMNEILPSLSAQEITWVQQHLKNYLETRHYDFYKPQIYKKIGLSNAFDLRANLLKDPKRIEMHMSRLKDLTDFLRKVHLLG